MKDKIFVGLFIFLAASQAWTWLKPEPAPADHSQELMEIRIQLENIEAHQDNIWARLNIHHEKIDTASKPVLHNLIDDFIARSGHDLPTND